MKLSIAEHNEITIMQDFVSAKERIMSACKLNWWTITKELFIAVGMIFIALELLGVLFLITK